MSHFNAIHFACHASARRADIALRTPKREWEGAALRNSETLCNNLLPVLGGGGVRDSSYRRAVEGWWENVAQVGRQEPAAARLRLALADVAMLLGRFATAPPPPASARIATAAAARATCGWCRTCCGSPRTSSRPIW